MDATVINIEVNNPTVEAKQATNPSLLNPNFRKHFLQTPCRCCGSNGHALLIQTKSRSGQTYFKYSCPVLGDYPDPSYLTEKEIFILTHSASHTKFAKHYHYDPKAISDALSLYRQQGIGKFTTKREFKDFRENINNSCNAYRIECVRRDHYRKSISGPCFICGNTQHSALTPYLTENGMLTYHYLCPVTAYENWEEANQFENQFQKYMICQNKFAKENQYERNKALAALDIFKGSSASLRWSTMAIERLELEICQICDNHYNEKQIQAKSQNQNNSRQSIQNLIQSSIHNLIKLTKHENLRTSIQNLIDPFDKSLTRLVIHNLVIGVICIILVFSANVAFKSPNHSS